MQRNRSAGERSSELFVKICGLTSPEQAVAVVECGVDAIGVNLVPSSPRYVEPGRARRIAEAVGGRVLRIAVVADRALQELAPLREACGCDLLQLHGDESPAVLTALLPHAFKAIRVGDARDVARAEDYAGDLILLDAKVAGTLGGSGQSFDWALVGALAGKRRAILAGGLRPDNVALAVRRVRPYGVDVASGVERGDPREKDLGLVRDFVQAAREAAR